MQVESLEKMTGDARSIPDARRLVKAMVVGRGDELAAVAELLTDELLTNAVGHGGGQFSLTASIDGQRLRVAVSDLRPSAPVTVYPPGHELERGRGLTIVDAVATDWGIDRLSSEKSVWFELHLA
jgi:anti-sigma regulatory factor (Ser/Thr protein kinase)